MTYVYENDAGERLELQRTVAERDNCPRGFRRVMVSPARPRGGPPTHGLFTGGARDPGEADLAVPRAFKELEQTMPADRIAREAGFSVNYIKDAWFNS